jgi:hypothetical protein
MEENGCSSNLLNESRNDEKIELIIPITKRGKT